MHCLPDFKCSRQLPTLSSPVVHLLTSGIEKLRPGGRQLDGCCDHWQHSSTASITSVLSIPDVSHLDCSPARPTHSDSAKRSSTLVRRTPGTPTSGRTSELSLSSQRHQTTIIATRPWRHRGVSSWLTPSRSSRTAVVTYFMTPPRCIEAEDLDQSIHRSSAEAAARIAGRPVSASSAANGPLKTGALQRSRQTKSIVWSTPRRHASEAYLIEVVASWQMTPFLDWWSPHVRLSLLLRTRCSVSSLARFVRWRRRLSSVGIALVSKADCVRSMTTKFGRHCRTSTRTTDRTK